jgi:hypothetical protein
VPNQQDQQAMADVFARHMDAELAGDLETTLATMTDSPHLVNVPSMVGGSGREGVHRGQLLPSRSQPLPALPRRARRAV